MIQKDRRKNIKTKITSWLAIGSMQTQHTLEWLISFILQQENDTHQECDRIIANIERHYADKEKEIRQDQEYKTANEIHTFVRKLWRAHSSGAGAPEASFNMDQYKETRSILVFIKDILERNKGSKK